MVAMMTRKPVKNSNVPITNTFERTLSNRISNGVSIRGGRCNAFEVKSDCTVMLFSPCLNRVIQFHVKPQKRGSKALHFLTLQQLAGSEAS